jgi:hypothetical protein
MPLNMMGVASQQTASESNCNATYSPKKVGKTRFVFCHVVVSRDRAHISGRVRRFLITSGEPRKTRKKGRKQERPPPTPQ